ncbi:hypothetical protein [Jannaschia rubra]|nr:hypothetical protein [Jannaschia rubra]
MTLPSSTKTILAAVALCLLWVPVLATALRAVDTLAGGDAHVARAEMAPD